MPKSRVDEHTKFKNPFYQPSAVKHEALEIPPDINIKQEPNSENDSGFVIASTRSVDIVDDDSDVRPWIEKAELFRNNDTVQRVSSRIDMDSNRYRYNIYCKSCRKYVPNMKRHDELHRGIERRRPRSKSYKRHRKYRRSYSPTSDDSGDNTYKCRKCLARFPNRKALHMHAALHKRKKRRRHTSSSSHRSTSESSDSSNRHRSDDSRRKRDRDGSVDSRSFEDSRRKRDRDGSVDSRSFEDSRRKRDRDGSVDSRSSEDSRRKRVRPHASTSKRKFSRGNSGDGTSSESRKRRRHAREDRHRARPHASTSKRKFSRGNSGDDTSSESRKRRRHAKDDRRKSSKHAGGTSRRENEPKIPKMTIINNKGKPTILASGSSSRGSPDERPQNQQKKPSRETDEIAQSSRRESHDASKPGKSSKRQPAEIAQSQKKTAASNTPVKSSAESSRLSNNQAPADRQSIESGERGIATNDDGSSTCLLCGDLFSSKELAIEHKAIHKNLKKFKCFRCRETLSSKNSLLRHQSFDKCSKRMKTLQELHCRTCNIDFNDKKGLISHKSIMHPNEQNLEIQPPVQPPETPVSKNDEQTPVSNGSGSRSMRIQQRRMSQVVPEKKDSSGVWCMTCVPPRMFEYKRSYLVHVTRMHKDSPQVAETSVNTSQNMEDTSKVVESQTLQNVAEETGSFQCPNCPRKFDQHRHMLIHSTKKHGEAPGKIEIDDENDDNILKCGFCNNPYSTEGNLKRHLLTCQKVVPCAECGERFRNQLLLSNHVFALHMKGKINATPIDPPSVEKNASVGQVERKPGRYHCSQCEISFRNQRLLNKHLTIHKPKNQAWCKLCKRFFKNYSQHKLGKHSGTPHKCEHCDKSFSLPATLRKHMDYHHWDKLVQLGPAETGNDAQQTSTAEGPLMTADNAVENSQKVIAYGKEFEFRQDAVHPNGVAVAASSSTDTSLVENSNEAAESCGTHDVRPTIRCQPCDRSFKMYSHLRLHMGKIHNRVLSPELTEDERREFLHSETSLKSPQGSETLGPLLTPDHPEFNSPTQSNGPSDNKQKTENSQKRRMLECDDCGKQYAREISLMKHKLTHHVTVYKCEICYRQFKREYHLKIHMTSHGGDTPYECPACPRKYKLKGHLTLHMRICPALKDPTAEDEINQPSQASGTWNDEQFFADDVETPVLPYDCEECGESFALEEDLQRHLFNHQEDVMVVHDASNPKGLPPVKLETLYDRSPFKCPHCPAAFKLKVALDHHVAKHTMNSFTCRQCGKAFATEAKMVLHARNHEVGIIAFKCKHCHSKFKNRDSWKAHERSAHDPNELRHSSNAEKTNGFQCQVCGKSYPTKQRLKSHEVVHFKPIECPSCDKVFKREGFLRSHVQKFHGTRKSVKFANEVECQLCPATFADTRELMEHVNANHSSG